MVYKPSEFTPLHGLVLSQIYTQAGVPPGVFNVVHGAGDVGAYLTAHPTIAKVSFTGQVATGKKVAGSAAGNMKYVTMELGGKSPLIVLPDADLESAADGAILANFFSTGQVCTNGTRVFVPANLKKQFETLLLQRMPYIRPGDLMDMDTNFGPLVSAVHYEKVKSYIRHGIEQDKARVLYGGLATPQSQSATPPPPAGNPASPNPTMSTSQIFNKGYWVSPTIFTDCTDDMKIVREEIFGPVMSILTYETIDEVVRRANDTPLGLAAGVFSSNINHAHRVVDQLQAGITWVNTWGESPAEMSVGGWKSSGVGVENGRRGIEAWVRSKSTLVDMSGKVATSFTKL